MAEYKILNEEQHDLIMNDIAALIGQIKKVEQSFNPTKLTKEIVDEFKNSLRKNSLFKSLSEESLELELNLIALKNVKKEFYECKSKSDLKLIITSIGSMFFGGVLSLFIIKLGGFF